MVNDQMVNEFMDNEQLKLENQLCFRLYSAARLTMGAYHPYLDPLGITYPQYLVLLVLWEQDKQPVCDIGKRLMLDTNTMTPLLQRMEKAGLISRTRGKEDTRQRIVSLTEQGKALREQAEHIPESMSKAVMASEEELAEILQMIPLLDKLIEELKKLNK
jgi:DNA-binding MarR family transcriptional regulator